MVLKVVVGGLDALGVDVSALLRRIGISEQQLDDPALFVPMDLHNRLWAEAEAATGDPFVGVRVASLTSFEVHHVLFGLVQHSATLGDAIVRLSRFGALLGAGFDLVLHVHGSEAVIAEAPYEGTQLHLQGVLCQLCTYALFGHQLTGTDMTPVQVRVARPRPAFADALDAAFRAPVRFDAADNALVFDSRLLHERVLNHDRERCESLEADGEALLQHMPARPSLARAVEGLLGLDFGGNGIQQLASLLKLNERTLTRRLAAEGTSYVLLRDRVRLQRARFLLETTEQSPADIGLTLGFSDGTAFSRAFRRWTGSSPSAHRAAHRKGR